MVFLRTAYYTKLDNMRNTDIQEEFLIDSVLENVQNYRNRLKSLVKRILSDRRLRKMFNYQAVGRRNKGRQLKDEVRQ